MKKAIFRPKMLFFVFRRLIADILTLAPSLFFVLRRLIADTYPLFSLDFASKLRIIYVFFVKICLFKNFLLSLHPKWVHQRSARIHMYSFQESIYAETICLVGHLDHVRVVERHRHVYRRRDSHDRTFPRYFDPADGKTSTPE